VGTSRHRPVQQGREADAEAIWIRDREVSQAVVAIPNRDDHPGTDVLRHPPAAVDIPDHDPDVGDWKLIGLYPDRGLHTLESGDLSEE
jgi:hypothetical protein